MHLVDGNPIAVDLGCEGLRTAVEVDQAVGAPENERERDRAEEHDGYDARDFVAYGLQHAVGVTVGLKEMAERTGLEPATPGVTGRYSNQLNYRSALKLLESCTSQEPAGGC